MSKTVFIPQDEPDDSNSLDFIQDINDIYEWDIDNERE